MDSLDAAALQLFTIGHSNHALETFLALLRRHAVEVLADVRSSPYSRYVSHFAKEELEQALKAAGINYLYLGRELGGRPDDADFYDADGHVLYARLAESPRFLEGIRRLQTGMRKHRVAIMCSEENPAVCHRHLLISRVLVRHGVAVLNIRGDGALEPDVPDFVQRSLFDDSEDSTWKSLRSVLPRRTPASSSDFSAEPAFDDSSTCD